MVMSMPVTLAAARGRRFSIPDRSGHLFGHTRRHPRRRERRLAPVGAGRHTNQLGEASGEGAQRRAADRETDLGDAEVATTQQGHRAFDASGHQIAVRRLAVGEPELAAEVPGRQVGAAGQGLDVQRLGVLPVDPVADATQQREVAQVLRRRGSAGHLRDRATSRRSCPAPLASGPTPSPLWPSPLRLRRDGVTLRLLWPQWQGAGTSSVQAYAPESPSRWPAGATPSARPSSPPSYLLTRARPRPHRSPWTTPAWSWPMGSRPRRPSSPSSHKLSRSSASTTRPGSSP